MEQQRGANGANGANGIGRISQPRKMPIGLKWRSSTAFIITTVGVGIFTDLFLYSIIVPVLPFLLKDRLHVPHSAIQSYVSGLLAAYAAASFVFSPFAGWLADKIEGRQRPFLAGLVALLLSTILLAIGTEIWVLAVARMLQGMSSAVVWTIGLAMCLETVGPGQLGTTIGSIFSVVAIGTQTSPVIGGLLYKKTGYVGVFGVGIALIVFDLIMRLMMIEKKTAEVYRVEQKRIDDETSSILGSPTETTALLPNNEQDGSGAGGEDLSAYILRPPQSKLFKQVPILACLGDAGILTALLVGSVQALLLGAFDATIPTVALEYYNFNSLQSGLLFLSLGIPSLLLGPVAGYCVDRFGTKPSATLAFLYLTPFLILLRLPQPGGADQIRLYAILLAFCGVGLAAIDAPSLVEGGIVMERYHRANPEYFGVNGPYAQLYSLNSMIFSAGLTLGPLGAGVLKDLIGYGNMNAVFAVFCAVTGVLSFLFIGGRAEWRKGWRELFKKN